MPNPMALHTSRRRRWPCRADARFALRPRQAFRAAIRSRIARRESQRRRGLWAQHLLCAFRNQRRPARRDASQNINHIFEGVNEHCVTHPTLAIESLDGKLAQGASNISPSRRRGSCSEGDVRIMTRLNACVLERPARKEACEPSSRIVRHPTKRAVRSVGSVYPTELAA